MRTTLSSMQWVIFFLTNTIVAPLSIGYAFGMPPDLIANLIQRSILIVGLISILQILFGHRLPIIEGPASVWWGVFLIYASVTVTIQDVYAVWQQLSLGLIISGVIFVLLGIFRITKYLSQLFTPLVTGIYLILLVAQLSGPFVTGMVGIGYYDDSINIKITAVSFIVLILSFIFSRSHITWLNRYAVLICLIIGWVIFKLFNLSKPLDIDVSNISVLPELFPYGIPQFDVGVLLTVIISTFLILANLLAAMKAVGPLVNEKQMMRFDQSNIILGFGQMFAGIFSTIGSIPLSSSAGFIMATKMREKLPFIIGAAFLIILSFFPMIMIFFASIPAPIGYATIFLSIANLGAVGLSQFMTEKLTMNKLVIFGLSLMLGIGAMLIPTDALTAFPNSIRTVLNNGLIIGVITCITLEQLTIKDNIRQKNL